MPHEARVVRLVFRLVIGPFVAAVIVMAGASYALGECQVFWTEAAQYEVWSICFNRELHTQSQERFGQQLVIVIQNRTQQLRPFVSALVWPASLFLKERPISRIPEVQAVTFSSYLVRHGQRWETLAQHSVGYMVLSAAGFNAGQTQALVHVDHVCGLCGHGDDVLLRKVNGRWIVEATANTWVS
jgi:hypothetical protein